MMDDCVRSLCRRLGMCSRALSRMRFDSGGLATLLVGSECAEYFLKHQQAVVTQCRGAERGCKKVPSFAGSSGAWPRQDTEPG